MSSALHPAGSARGRWILAAVYAVVAAIPQLLLLGTEVGFLPRAWTFLFGDNAVLPTILLGGAEVSPLAWAWAVFFGIMAIVTAAVQDTGVSAKRGPEDGDRDELSGEAEIPTTQPLYGGGSEPPTYEPKTGFGDNLPAVDIEAAGSSYGEGSRLYGLGQYEDAIRSFDRALELNPRSTAAWQSKGISLCALGRYEQGILCFNEALLLDRQNARLWQDKGNALAKLSRRGDAIRCFKKAHELDPSYPSVEQ